MSKALIRTNRNYRLLLSASSVSNLGDGIAMVALPWLATMLTSDPLLISAVATAQRLPWLLFSLPVGRGQIGPTGDCSCFGPIWCVLH